MHPLTEHSQTTHPVTTDATDLFTYLNRLSQESADDPTPSQHIFVSGEESFKGIW